MTDEVYDIGDVVRLTATFRDEDDALADPDEVTVTVQAPDGTETTPEASSDSTGVWTATVEPDAHGTWRYRFQGTGAVTSAAEGVFVVRRQRVGA